jgi:hypothetical protein
MRMSLTMTIEVSVPCVPAGRCGRKELRPEGERAVLPPGRVPRVSRLMALALRLDELVRTGQVASYRELATMGHVTRARVSQIASLLHLAPGAVGARDGRLAEVGSGTLMLDDIDGLPRPCKSSCCEPLRSAFSRPLARTDRIRCGPDLLVR